MKLYKIEQKEHNDWDTYDAFIVAAKDPEDAKHIVELSEDKYGSWAFTYDAITVTEIGKALSTIDRGVILGSYNAG